MALKQRLDVIVHLESRLTTAKVKYYTSQTLQELLLIVSTEIDTAGNIVIPVSIRDRLYYYKNRNLLPSDIPSLMEVYKEVILWKSLI